MLALVVLALAAGAAGKICNKRLTAFDIPGREELVARPPGPVIDHSLWDSVLKSVVVRGKINGVELTTIDYRCDGAGGRVPRGRGLRLRARGSTRPRSQSGSLGPPPFAGPPGRRLRPHSVPPTIPLSPFGAP